jgi:C4-type Zn-finger protein
MIVIKDVPTVTGKLTVYHDITLEDIKCPFCEQDLSFNQESISVGQNNWATQFNFRCSPCGFEFNGIKDEHEFPDIQSFHKYVSDKIKGLKIKGLRRKV